ncbi:MAG: tetratricopeptide repeat protein [Treponema sp.]|nr:tetratricopeptide repeat protein [Treponema sp.]
MDNNEKTGRGAAFSEEGKIIPVNNINALIRAETPEPPKKISAIQMLANLASETKQMNADIDESNANEARQTAESMGITDIDQAVAEYTEALKCRPNDAAAKDRLASAYYIRGLTFDSKGDYARAVEEYSGAVNNKKDYSLALDKRGAAYCKVSDYDRAVKDYEKLVEINPADEESKRNLARAYRRRANVSKEEGDYARSISDLEAVLKYTPDDNYSRKLLETMKADIKNLNELP